MVWIENLAKMQCNALERLFTEQICTLKISEFRKKNSAILKVTYLLSVLTLVYVGVHLLDSYI